jgi:hypothetical protein
MDISSTGAATFSVNTNASLLITNSGQTPILSFRSNGVTAAGRIRVDEAFGGGEMIFSTKTTGGVDTDRMAITTSGNVGIGTASPSSLFTVAGTSDLAFSNATTILRINRSGSQARIQNYDGGSVAPIALNWEGGNVLIGTTTDSGDKLRVNGTTFTNDIMTFNPQNDNRSGVAWRLGAATIGTDTLNRRLRVNVGGVEYYIGAVEV